MFIINELYINLDPGNQQTNIIQLNFQRRIDEEKIIISRKHFYIYYSFCHRKKLHFSPSVTLRGFFFQSYSL